MEELFKRLIGHTGEQTDREGLQRTPERAARAFRFLTSGYHADFASLVNGALFASESDELIVVRNIEFYSLCEHHLLPFFGTCHIGYLPKGNIIGLSKIPRIVDVYARRLQLQERLTTEVASALREVTGASGVGVVMEARHLCMMMRGVEKQHSSMKTSCMLGAFRESSKTRNEFFELIR
ncbi:GTP cyclohydrolase I FolE [Candidatus Woesearchaeota archaeon]|nr:GTP cyclohydrolase I FolE [Candidatus Woesearchaeota archaeon]